MHRNGLLETMACRDLDAVIASVSQSYRSGSLATAVRDPAWREALERAEREVGELYGALCEADATLARWRVALAELYRLWSRLGEPPEAGRPEPAATLTLERVA